MQLAWPGRLGDPRGVHGTFDVLSTVSRPCCACSIYNVVHAVGSILYPEQVKAAVLDPENEFNVERTLTKDDVKKLIRVSQSIFPP